ncbi:hypothetical protein FUAX_36320 [Fulvitalea axinellae]|uniref:PhoU domain-containing protein n=1 Tax=Fulvitalea axinellae TaxID=1182444 RepID=A0AAU9DJ56_9BACT|nr:hypothetical protein FUAX_36320 [Fulvitalea axinellae]
MSFGFIELLKIVGALGFFIYGMKVMSEGIQNVAGDKMRSILGTMTSNRVLGLLSGVGITVLIQSSSATTVMVVSFVNAGLMTLGQSIGVIMGANIGTTVTSWLLSFLGFGKFKIAAIALPIIAVAFPMMFSKNVKVKQWAEVLIGFALLFMGLQELKGTMTAILPQDMKSNPEALSFISFLNDLGFAAVPIAVIFGALLTVLVQSSSAAMAITLTLVSSGIIPLDIACGIVMGENIGTTVTANMAAMIGNVYAKRAARAHLIFNVFGVLWMFLVFPFFVSGVKYMIVDVLGYAEGSGDYFRYGLSLFHTAFNIVNVLLLIWFVNAIKKIVIKMVPTKHERDEESHLEYMGEGIASSLQEAREEVRRFGVLASEIGEDIETMLKASSAKEVEGCFAKVKAKEQRTDELKTEVAAYLTKLAEASPMGSGGSMGIQELMSIIDDLERTADIHLRIAKAINKKHSKGIEFTDKQTKNLLQMCDLNKEAFAKMNEHLELENVEPDNRDFAYEIEKKIDEQRKVYRKQNIKAIEQGDYSIKSGILYYDMVFSFELLGNHIYNVTKDLVEID